MRRIMRRCDLLWIEATISLAAALKSTRNQFGFIKPALVSGSLVQLGPACLPRTDDYLRFFFGCSSGIPTQVVNPSVSRATTPHGTAFTVFVETPSWSTTFNPGPVLTEGNGPAEYGGGGAALGAYAPV
jgi:hypothetical protein